jgi:hypothetical protein
MLRLKFFAFFTPLPSRRRALSSERHRQVRQAAQRHRTAEQPSRGRAQPWSFGDL